MSPLTERIRALSDTPLFAGLETPELRALAERGIERRFHAGDTLFAEGDACPGLHVLIGGSVKICKTSPGGREVMLAIESAPSSVAEVPLFDGGAYPATVVAIDEVTALIIRCPDFRAVCIEHPEIPIRLLSAVGRRLRAIVALVDSLTFGCVRQRLARTLLDFRDEAGDDTFKLPTSLQELAHRLGTAREVISRNMSRFQAHGLLNLHKGQVVILNRHGLLHEAETEV